MVDIFDKQNRIEELTMDTDNDCVLVLHPVGSGDEPDKASFTLAFPPFKGTNTEFPGHIATAIVVAACLYYNDADFQKLVEDKFQEYGKQYLEHVFPGGIK